MNYTFTSIAREPALTKDMVTQIFLCHTSTQPADAMAELRIGTVVEGVKAATVNYVDVNGITLYQHNLLVLSGTIQASILHVPAGTSELQVFIDLPRQFVLDEISCELKFPGKVIGLLKLAAYVYKVNRMRGVSIPELLREKTQQLYRLGLTNLFKSPVSHIDLHEFAKLDYKNWLKSSTEYLLKHGKIKYLKNDQKLAVFIDGHEDIQQLADSLQALGNLKTAELQVHVLMAERNSVLPDMVRKAPFSVSVVAPDLFRSVIASAAAHNDWCCFLDAGDVIRPHALHVLTRFAQSNPDCTVFYGDHDVLEGEERHSPQFKPRWSREYYLHFDYIGRAVYYRGDWLANQTLPEEYPLIHERLLLSTDFSSGSAPYRIPDVLFSFPVQSGEHTVSTLPHKREHLVSELLDSRGIAHNWKEGIPGVSRDFIDYSTCYSDGLPLVSLIIPTRDQVRLIKSCIESILTCTDYPRLEIIIVDNGSRDTRTLNFLDACQAKPACTVLRYNAPFNFSAINNFAIQRASGELVGLVNNDIKAFRPEWLRNMAAYFALPDVGAVGAKLMYRDMRVQHAGVLCGLGNVAGHAHRFANSTADGYMNRLQVPGEFSAVTGACLLTRRSMYMAQGGLNAEELAVAYNDVDYCLRLRKAGYRVIFAPQAELFHLESSSRGSDDSAKKKSRYKGEIAYMWNKWRAELEDDEYYNPNLTKAREDFSVGQPSSAVRRPGLMR